MTPQHYQQSEGLCLANVVYVCVGGADQKNHYELMCYPITMYVTRDELLQAVKT